MVQDQPKADRSGLLAGQVIEFFSDPGTFIYCHRFILDRLFCRPVADGRSVSLNIEFFGTDIEPDRINDRPAAIIGNTNQHALAAVEACQTILFECPGMDENILSMSLDHDKTIALILIEELNLSQFFTFFLFGGIKPVGQGGRSTP